LSFPEEGVKKIKDHNFDVILRLGSGILTGQILNTPRFGVISMHHGDNRVNRGGPPGFWEVLNREPSTGFIIQKLTDICKRSPNIF
jgi:methionyl-tRNA formyltransferase